MLCNIYTKQRTPELTRMGINSDSPLFFVNLPPDLITALKKNHVENVFEVYLVQEDPYLKTLSDKWMNGGVILPEIKIFEKIVQGPVRTIEKTIEVIKEVEVEVEVIKEVIKEVYINTAEPIKGNILTEESKVEEIKEDVNIDNSDEEGFLIDTKVAFDDWMTKISKMDKSVNEEVKEVLTEETKKEVPVIKAKSEVEDDEELILPDIVEAIEASYDEEPILLTNFEVAEDKTEEIKKKPKKSRKKKTVEPEVEFIVELSEREKEIYQAEGME